MEDDEPCRPKLSKSDEELISLSLDSAASLYVRW